MSRLCFDYGHGGSDPGACYNGRNESNDVLAIGREVAKEVRRHGVVGDEIRATDATLSLQQRSNYDYFISFHRNAFKPEAATGAETYTYLNQNSRSKAMADKIQTAVVNVGFVNRGVKKANFHVLRETKASAVLIELGFIDNSKDNSLFDTKKKEIIKAISKAILAQLGIAYKEESVSNSSDGKTLYRVMVGSFSIRENADKQVQKLKAAGFDATVMIFNK
ncbi:N-acetylmuramoyl-L-alanine amidase [uncultured Clostridium sp.]|uniref:N-acetylmuramoyl-L-alanine amidase n=1 Tax=uncultured Clostridium sp. TaxID=59620 RepID=UPI002671F9D0|nr:N-acetylmuramoyl-L-alanine amidase [uncultured Clostridium sp.]